MTLPPDSSPPRPVSLIALGPASLTRFAADGSAEKVLKEGKPLALLIYLAAAGNRSASREHLINMLWTDVDPEHGLRTLRQTVWHIRQSLGEDALIGDGRELTLALPLKFDRDEFIAAIAKGDFEEAVRIYKGPFIPDFGVPGGAEFEHWADRERDRLQAAYVRAAETLVRTRLDHAQYDIAILEARRLRDSDPQRESSWRLLLEVLSSSGDRRSAASEAEKLERLLASDDRDPERLTLSAITRAKRLQPVVTPQESAMERLVPGLTGREREFSLLTGAWTAVKGGRFRHIHVTAPPGFGKTRLLQDVCTRLRAAGARSVFVSALHSDRRLAYALASDVAAKVGNISGASGISTAAASSLVALNPTLSSSFAATPDPSDGEEALRHRVHAIAELVDAVAEEAPFALFIDDLHWSDPVSRQLLKSVFSRISGSRLLLITSARTVPDGDLHLATTESLTLDPLSPGHVRELIAGFGTLPDARWVDPFLAAIHQHTGGSPLLVLENLHLALDRGLLKLRNNSWECAGEDALLEEISRGDVLEQRLKKLEPPLTIAESAVRLSPRDERAAMHGSILGESSPSEAAGRLVASLPVMQRFGLNNGWRVAALSAFLLVAAVISFRFIQSRPAELVIMMQPLAASLQVVPPPVIVIQDETGHRVRGATNSVTVDAVGGKPGLEGTLTVSAIDGRAEFKDITLTGEGAASLRFRAAGLREVIANALNTHERHSTLRLVSAVINRQSLSARQHRIVVGRGEEIAGTLRLEYSSYWASASVILGATPTWGDRRTSFVGLAPLFTPAVNQPRGANIRFKAPETAGIYHIIVAFDAEGGVEDFMSGTNWRIPKPIWNDGNDIVDWTPAQLAQANALGWVQTKFVKVDDTACSYRHLTQAHEVPATVIDVVVR